MPTNSRPNRRIHENDDNDDDTRRRKCTPTQQTETPATSPTEQTGEELTEQTPVSTLRPAEKYHLAILSHNVRGTKEMKDVDGSRVNTKLEYIALYMEEMNVDVYLLQETWLTGNIDHWYINGITFFTHGPDEQTSSRGRGGLAIGLSRKALKAWTRAGKKEIRRHGTMDGTTRIMGIDLRVPSGNSFEDLTIFNIYAPSTHGNDMDTVDNFWTELEDDIRSIPASSTPIVAGDINARIGNRLSHPESDELYFGPWGDNRLNEAGTKVVPLMQRCALRAASTFFEHKKYWTFKCHLQNEFKTLDHFLTHVKLSEFICDAKRIVGGPPSDHDPIILRLQFAQRKKGFPAPETQKIRIAWEKLDNPLTAIEFRKLAKQNMKTLTDKGLPTAKAFSKALVTAAEHTCFEDDPAKSGWFAEARKTLTPLIEARNLASEALKELPSDDNAANFKKTRQELKRATTTAKHRSEFKKAVGIMKTMRAKPREAWAKMRNLQAGHNSHHKIQQVLNFSQEGVKATNDKQNLEFACKHFEKVYNMDSSYDPSVVDDIPQYPDSPDFDQLPSFEELDSAISDMASLAAPGDSGLSPMAMKKLPREMKLILLNIIHRYWNGLDPNPEWNQALLCIIYKKKGKHDDLNNYRGICLQDLIARYVSSIISSRLLILLKEHGIEEQLGCQPLRGCRDALFIVRSALQIRHKHMHDTWVLFVDLVKAFDTIDRELLFEILAKFGIPQSMIYVIRRLYDETEIKISVGTEKENIKNTMGVKQGDAMAAVLFILVMQAMAETLTPLWEAANIATPQFRFHKETKAFYGKMKGQNYKTKGTMFELFLSLYVDDGSFMFESREDMKKGTAILYHHMRRFGLLMHIGRDGGKSKTEALYIPAPGTIISDADRLKVVVDGTDQGYVTFNRKFTYLGSIITEDLEDNAEINARIGKANGILYSLNNLWRSKGLTLAMKKQFYVATIVNILLWGCESLTLRAANLKKLEVFHHKGIRHVLNVNKWKQKNERITNCSLRQKLDNIATIQETIEERRLDWLGNVARQPDTNLPKRLLTAWTSRPRNNCGQKLTLRDSNAAAINRMLIYNDIPAPSKECPSKTWVPLTKEPSLWSTMIYKRRNDRLKQKSHEERKKHTQPTSTSPTNVPVHYCNATNDPIDTEPREIMQSPISNPPPPPLPPEASNPFLFQLSPHAPPFLPPLSIIPSDVCSRLASYLLTGIIGTSADNG
jgi:exonuclease III